jgi:hypothetical protein
MVRSVQDVSAEKFTAIEGTFASNALALTAALAAQKEAAAEAKKSSDLAIDRANSTTKDTIVSNAAQFSNSLASQAATIADLKDRVVRIESGGAATSAARGETRQDATFGQTAQLAATADQHAREIASAAGQRAVLAAVISAVAVLVAIVSVVVLIAHH